MKKSKKFDFEEPVPVIDVEDQETLAAIDEGIGDADAGRTLPSDDVRKLMAQWTSNSPTRKGR